jgi:hypothetical protein
MDFTAVPQGFPPLADLAATMLAVPSVEERAVGFVLIRSQAICAFEDPDAIGECVAVG